MQHFSRSAREGINGQASLENVRGGTAQGRVEQGQTGQGRVEQGRVEQGRARQGRVEQGQTGQGRAALGLIGAIAFFATMPIYSPNVESLFTVSLNSDLVGAFIMPMFVSAFMVAGALGTRSLVLKKNLPEGFAPQVTIHVAYCLATAVFYLMLLGFVPSGTQSVGLLGILCGALFVPTAILWGKRLAPRTLSEGLAVVSIICGVTALLNWAIPHLPALGMAIAFAAMLVISAAAYLMCPDQPLALMRNKRVGEEGFAEAPTAMSLPLRQACAQFASVMTPAMVGLSMFAFFMGAAKLKIGGAIGAESLGSLLACATLLPVLHFAPRIKAPLQTLFHTLILPCVATLILAIIAVVGEPNISQTSPVLGMAVYWFFSMAAFLALSLTLVGSTGREFPAELVISTTILCFCAFSMAGLTFGAQTGIAKEASQYMPAIAVSLYCVYLVLQVLVSPWISSQHGHQQDEVNGNAAVGLTCSAVRAEGATGQGGEGQGKNAVGADASPAESMLTANFAEAGGANPIGAASFAEVRCGSLSELHFSPRSDAQTTSEPQTRQRQDARTLETSKKQNVGAGNEHIKHDGESGQDEKRGWNRHESPAPMATPLEQRCEIASSRYGLSPREREILQYLSQGHTAGYVAKTLVISENTVYTHTRNMYQKMGISSREQLLLLLSQIEE